MNNLDPPPQVNTFDWIWRKWLNNLREFILERQPTTGTEVASTSGTSIDFTVPAWAKSIHILFVGVSTNGTSVPIIQLGDSGGIETTGYLGASVAITHGASPSVSNLTSGFIIFGTLAANVMHGSVTLRLENGATWVCEGTLAYSNTTAVSIMGGSKTLSATLNSVRITTANGTDTFDAGSINIQYR